tara:strand:+ start:1577 stop:2992 length:1416 start_codon:yes stop_codon:yes gene_type:complete
VNFFKKINNYIVFYIKFYFTIFSLVFYRNFGPDKGYRIIDKVYLSYEKKIFFLNYFIKKYPSYPYFYYLMFLYKFRLGQKDYNLFLKTYFDKRETFVQEKLKQSKETEFMEEHIVTGSFGNIIQLYLLLLANRLGLRNKKKIVLLLNNKITNNALFEYFKNDITIINKKDISKNLKFLSKQLNCHLGSVVEFKDGFKPTFVACNYINKQNEEKNILLFNIKKSHVQSGEKYLKEIGLKESDWYVTLHVRDNTYRKKESNESFRNADIEDYIPAINEITKAGGYVFRMGHLGSKKISAQNKYIDYANSKYKSEELDVFLGGTSKFCIATSSGFYIIPAMFSVPILMTNCPQHGVFFELKKRDIYLPRIFKSKIDGKFLKLKTIFNYPYTNLANDKSYEENKIKVIKNSSEEIKNATIEMLKQTEKKIENNLYSDLQKNINLKIHNLQNEKNTNLEPLSKISHYFLEKNLNII